MLCQNCHETEANVYYTQVINGVKKEMRLCEVCAEKLGIGDVSFHLPMSFSTFFGDLLDQADSDFIRPLTSPTSLACPTCHMNYQEWMESGTLGCYDCYSTFSQVLDPVLKNLQGGNRHIGRRTKNLKQTSFKKAQEEPKVKKVAKKDLKKELKAQLEKAIQEERYEEAAKIRDKLKDYENKKKEE